MTRLRKRIIVLIVALLWSSLAHPGIAAEPQPPQQTEYKLKAAFLLNFLHFIDWPSRAFTSDSSAFVIGVVGDDPFDGALDQIVKGESVNGKVIEVRSVSSVESAKQCQLLFFPKTQSERVAQFIEAVSGTATLTVGESEDFSSLGGEINFYLEDAKLRFEINLPALQKSGLEVSSKLLRLAKVKQTK
jgi:hypothetical protein